MAQTSRARGQERAKRRTKAREAGWELVKENVLLRFLAEHTDTAEGYVRQTLDGAAAVDSWGEITVDEERDATPEDWARIFTHLLLHLGLGHLDEAKLREAGVTPGDPVPVPYATACCVAVERFTDGIRVGPVPAGRPELPEGDERTLAELWTRTTIPDGLRELGVNGALACFAYRTPATYWNPPVNPDWPADFAQGLVEAIEDSVVTASESGGVKRGRRQEPWHKAMNWFVSSYPLLGGLAGAMTLVDDAADVRSLGISISAVRPKTGEIFINPTVRMTAEEWRFVLAHNMLHAALGHDRRVQWRDPQMFGVACDYVVNGWLVEMAVGYMPDGFLYDPGYKDMAVEAVYDELAADPRRTLKLRTPGAKTGDLLGDWLNMPSAVASKLTVATVLNFEPVYKRALTTGLAYCKLERGFLPSGLVEEIRALDHPPLPWDAELARWFDEHVRSPERRRTYGRPSRRQSATPDIPRPGHYFPEELVAQATFGVLLDTSGSMNRELLGKALGAIASYATAHDVPRARVVFCDAVAYDAGYLDVSDIAGRMQVRGRGGTILQPGIDMLEKAEDFPADGPILIITDGDIEERLTVRRQHAYLLPEGARLPYAPRGAVFRVV